MEKISPSEVEFIVKSIKAGVRLDNRDFNEIRKQSVIANTATLADSSIKIKRGNTELDMNLLFKTSFNSLKILNLSPDLHENRNKESEFKIFQKYSNLDTSTSEINTEELKTFRINFNHPNPTIIKIEEFLEKHNIGCQIEINTIRDDGNIFDIVMEGLRLLFSSINIPDINNLISEINTGLDLPVSTTFSIFEDMCIVDPTHLEEISSTGKVHIFSMDDKKTVFIEEKCDFDTVLKILGSFNHVY